MASNDEAAMEKRIKELYKELGKKHMFEEALSSIRSLFHIYPSSSPSLRNSIYSLVCRVATVLQTRHTAPGFWHAGLVLFEEVEQLVTDSSQKAHLKKCIARAREHLHEIENKPEVQESNPRRDSRYLFEGHLTVDPEPEPVAPSLLRTIVATQGLNAAIESSQIREQSSSISEGSTSTNPQILQELIQYFQEIRGMQDLDGAIEASIQEIGAGPQRPPPASKELVANLPIVTVTDEILTRLGSETECAVCRENLVMNDKMQELPCKHLFHPNCLKPWLDEHNSCPICRHELKTDDHAYESWKEREKEAEEERKGAANAIRGGEYMYV